jgi:hypothetical protein
MAGQLSVALTGLSVCASQIVGIVVRWFDTANDYGGSGIQGAKYVFGILSTLKGSAKHWFLPFPFFLFTLIGWLLIHIANSSVLLIGRAS